MKGYFPHKFNLPENQNYVGTYPDISYYGSEFFSQKKKKDFENWYETVKYDSFNFREQFHAYCWSDVMLLANGCLAFRKVLMNRTKKSENDVGVDPFLCSITIASLCHFIFRRNLLEK
ncbi:unnamed protein product [Brachionus calyciflorus]|uniref:DNA-directed DNA polymerase n=1 Tax=Brachionus calyciflorus TaxID=104777 RepID=A0A814JB03_9BILA|nr:unnamed protein product [Brachionus calyciflorus]